VGALKAAAPFPVEAGIFVSLLALLTLAGVLLRLARAGANGAQSPPPRFPDLPKEEMTDAQKRDYITKGVEAADKALSLKSQLPKLRWIVFDDPRGLAFYDDPILRSFASVREEGRKFGLSLIVASQRPSEISPTIISQCANFFSHRLQNPDDIDHFKRIIPRQAQRLLDQVTVLSSGEAIVFGSAVHVPSRVQIKIPSQEPSSTTAAPYVDWSKAEKFPLSVVLEAWGLVDEKHK
jgi:hypothetical protein